MPTHDELMAEEERVNAGTEDWLRWWRATGKRELSCLLMAAWDPIGVGDATEAWGEYDEYAPGVANRLRDAVHRDEAIDHVAAYLNHVERDWIEIFTARRGRANRRFAETLVAWHEWSSGRQPPSGPDGDG